jgi:hypothetical protein
MNATSGRSSIALFTPLGLSDAFVHLITCEHGEKLVSAAVSLLSARACSTRERERVPCSRGYGR